MVKLFAAQSAGCGFNSRMDRTFSLKSPAALITTPPGIPGERQDKEAGHLGIRAMCTEMVASRMER